MQTTAARPMRLPLAMIAAFAAVSASALAVVGLGGSVLFAFYLLTRMLFPASTAAALGAVRALPAAPLAFLAMLAAPIVVFEVAIGLWLFVKWVRIPERT